MKFPIVTRRRAQSAIDVATVGLRHQLEQTASERDTALRDLRRTQATLRATADRLREVTAANQSYDKEIGS